MITTIRSPLIDNFLRIIQSLAKRGRNAYHQYLVDPLSRWSTAVPVEPMDRLLTLLDQARAGGGKKLPLLYKMSIIKAVAPDQFDLSLPGNLSMGFLKSMKEEQRVAMSDEAIEFVNILKDPFKDYSDSEFIRMNKKFEEEISSVGEVEVEKLIRAHEGEEAASREIDQQSEKSLARIRDMMRTADIPDIKREVIVYLLKYADPSMPNRHLAVRNVIAPLELKNKTFMNEVMDSAAVIIYHEILKAIKENNMLKAVKHIGTYAVLFRGNPETPNYREVDSFEKKFIKLIDERNLWDRLQ
ncbi:MAG TPA: hypothetical protein PLM53_14335 [Spirochaetota bacterium]|nr:hypothetical protein [Spirochaetota bacterium]HPC41649.1 hypothetical protein [Spirochaetota bacterium]HPL16346.1 hypothetical protein [Spirochaetota bacterium]HQF09326.1 hypothetical protein [Spirochaetota bacterium]HQH98274.1 hypothetical protein [Spirochaetota bacterium]